MQKTELIKNLISVKYNSQAEFCEKTGVKPSTLSTIFKRGINGTAIDTMIKICKGLDISIDKLADLDSDNFYINDIEKELITKIRQLPAVEQTKILGMIEYKLSELDNHCKV